MLIRSIPKGPAQMRTTTMTTQMVGIILVRNRPKGFPRTEQCRMILMDWTSKA